MQITTIIFDLAEVLLTGLLGVERHLEPILGIRAEEIEKMLHGKELISLFHGEITEEEYWLKVTKKNRWDVNVRILKETIRSNFVEIEGTRRIVERLKEKGYKLGLLSVHTKEWVDHCVKKFDYHKLFHSTQYSFEVQLSKPDKRAYKLILQKLASKPEECLFIDDNPKNVKAAEELGMQTIHFKNAKQLKKELELRHIL